MTIVDELRRLLGEATPGPWEAMAGGIVRTAGDSTYPFQRVADTGLGVHVDARLIATMRNALPALLDVVEAARRVEETEARGPKMWSGRRGPCWNAGTPTEYVAPLVRAGIARERERCESEVAVAVRLADECVRLADEEKCVCCQTEPHQAHGGGCLVNAWDIHTAGRDGE